MYNKIIETNDYTNTNIVCHFSALQKMRKIDEGTLSKSDIAMSSLRKKRHRIPSSIIKLKKSLIRKNEDERIEKCVEKQEECLERQNVPVQGKYYCVSFSVTTKLSIMMFLFIFMFTSIKPRHLF